MHALAPAEPQRAREQPLLHECLIALQLGRADCRQPRRQRDRLQQRRLTRAVVTDEARDGRVQLEPWQCADSRHTERKTAARRACGVQLDTAEMNGCCRQSTRGDVRRADLPARKHNDFRHSTRRMRPRQTCRYRKGPSRDRGPDRRLDAGCATTPLRRRSCRCFIGHWSAGVTASPRDGRYRLSEVIVTPEWIRYLPRTTALSPENLMRRLALVILVAGCAAGPPAFDVIIRGGTVYDGSGSAPLRADIAITGDSIVQIGGDLAAAQAPLVIDATGLAVAPGFINMLSWATESLIQDGRSQSDIRQGVTLELFGEGSSMGPLNEQMKQQMKEQQGDIKFD